jgi:hypothetical protein
MLLPVSARHAAAAAAAVAVAAARLLTFISISRSKLMPCACTLTASTSLLLTCGTNRQHTQAHALPRCAADGRVHARAAATAWARASTRTHAARLAGSAMTAFTSPALSSTRAPCSAASDTSAGSVRHATVVTTDQS